MTDDLEERLTRSLQHRADAVAASRTPSKAVAARAHAVRRTRQRRALAAVAGGVLAIAVTAAVVHQSDRPRFTGPGPATGVMTPPPPGGPPTGLAALPRGRDPEIGVLVDSTYTDSSSDPARQLMLSPLPGGAQVGSLTPFDGGVLTGDDRYFEGSNGLRLVTFGVGTARDLKPCTSGGGAADADRSTVAWVSFACPESGVAAPNLLHVLDAGGTERTSPIDTLGVNPGFRLLVGLSDDFAVVNLSDDALVVGLDRPSRLIPGVDAVLSMDETTGAVAAFLNGQRACAVLDPETGEQRFTSPTAWPLADFSPDGTRIVAYRASANGTLVIRVLSARTGSVEHQWTLPDGVAVDFDAGPPVWADDDHLLLLVRDDSGQAVVRADLDGSLERASEVYNLDRRLLLSR